MLFQVWTKVVFPNIIDKYLLTNYQNLPEISRIWSILIVCYFYWTVRYLITNSSIKITNSSISIKFWQAQASRRELQNSESPIPLHFRNDFHAFLSPCSGRAIRLAKHLMAHGFQRHFERWCCRVVPRGADVRIAEYVCFHSCFHTFCSAWSAAGLAKWRLVNGFQ